MAAEQALLAGYPEEETLGGSAVVAHSHAGRRIAARSRNSYGAKEAAYMAEPSAPRDWAAHLHTETDRWVRSGMIVPSTIST